MSYPRLVLDGDHAEGAHLLGLDVVPFVVHGGAALSAFLFALTEPVLLAAIQRRVPDHARATVLSIKSLFATIFLTLTEPALGLLSDNFGVHTAYLGMAALIALFSLTLLLKGRRWVSTHSPT